MEILSIIKLSSEHTNTYATSCRERTIFFHLGMPDTLALAANNYK